MNLSEVFVRPVLPLEEKRFSHPLVMLETFVYPQKFRGTIYKADNGIFVGNTKGLNDYLTFPHVGQVFVIQREVTEKKTGKYSCDIAYGLTSVAQKMRQLTRNVRQVFDYLKMTKNSCVTN